MIDRTMSERVLTYWVKKIGDKMEIPNCLRSYEFIYLLINTVKKSEFVSRKGVTG